MGYLRLLTKFKILLSIIQELLTLNRRQSTLTYVERLRRNLTTYVEHTVLGQGHRKRKDESGWSRGPHPNYSSKKKVTPEDITLYHFQVEENSYRKKGTVYTSERK